MEPLAPIPTPPAQRWREFRIQALPVLTFIAVMCGVGALWTTYIVPTNIVGEVEVTQAQIISAVPGTLREVKVHRFQRVKAGEEIAVISTMDAATLQAQLKAVEADLKLLRARMQLDVERNLQSYELARLDYMSERAELASERVNRVYYDAEVARQQQLLTNNPPLVSATEVEYWQRLADITRTNIMERELYLAEKEKTLPKLAPATQADDAILEAIKAQEEALRAAEQTISLKAPFDGIVTSVLRHAGEKIVDNTPIVTISAAQPTRIVGYVRRPYAVVPQAGDAIQIRRQGFKRELVETRVLDVGATLEPISTALVPPQNIGTNELGLPFSVAIPPELALIPGEAVDLIIKKK
jgi:multidrug resistance efflux pump